MIGGKHVEVTYGKEPFDLRLTILRLCRNLWKILTVTVVGTLLSGGGYYVKNVLLQPDPGYAASSTYKVEYVENPNAAGAYYINEATWNSLIHTGEFLDGVEKHLQEAAAQGNDKAAEVLTMGREQWIAALSATLPSDFSIPVTRAATQDPEQSIALAHAVEDTMCNEFAESIVEINRIKVLDPGDRAEAVVPDVRPVRAVILAAVLSLFFAVVIFLLWEISGDGLWLPATLRRRYGLLSLGTVESTEFTENLKYTLEKAVKGKTPEQSGEEKGRDCLRVAVCGALPDVDPQEVVDRLLTIGTNTDNAETMMISGVRVKYTAVPSPLLSPESTAALRGSDAVLLAVPAGRYVGKQLEAVLEILKTQDCTIAGSILWNADEALIRQYYFLPCALQEKVTPWEKTVGDRNPADSAQENSKKNDGGKQA